MPSEGRGIRLSARECHLLLLLGAPVLLVHLCDWVCQLGEAAGFHYQRDLVLLELFSGESVLTQTFRAAHQKSQWFDILGRGSANDILQPGGFLFALRETMRLGPGSLLFAGVPCCSWVWISSFTTQRFTSILGDEREKCVLFGNQIAARFALLCLVAYVLKAHHVVEQPTSSRLVFFPYMQFIWQHYGALFKRFWMCNFDHWSMKPSYLVGTPKWIAALSSQVDPVRKEAIQQNGDNGMVKKTVSKASQKKSVSGGPALKKSAAYTKTFAEWVLEQHMASSSQPVEVEPPQELARAPFDWSHANLEPLREMLLLAKQQGTFSPQPDLPL